MKKSKIPMQPAHLVNGVLRFRKNALVCHLLEVVTRVGVGLNELCRVSCPPDERDQFQQLIGYSVSGAPLRTKRARRKRDKIQAAYEQGEIR